MTQEEYVLRPRDEQEIHRLGFQHEVWREATRRVLEASGFHSGDHVLDMGCGPGYLSLELRDLVGKTGQVLSLDTSETFVGYLRNRVNQLELEGIQAEVGDLRDFPFPAHSLDGAICRWVLMFLSEPERALKNVVQALKPGAKLVIMEYVAFQSMSLWPVGEEFQKIYAAVSQLLARSGGDANFGGRVPQILEGLELEVQELLPIWRVGRPGSPLWRWLEQTQKNHTNLVDAQLITSADLKAHYEEWERCSKIQGAFFTAPPVLATIARKSTA